MAKFVGRRFAVGLGKESTRGTAVAPTYWLTWNEIDIADEADFAIDEASLARIEGSDNQALVSQQAGGTVKGKVKDRSLGLLLLSLFGTIASVARAGGDSAVYDHTFSVANTNQHQSLTVGLKSPNEDVAIANAICDRFDLELVTGAYAMFEARILGKKSATASQTVATIVENEFVPKNVTVKLAANLAGLDGASAVTVKALKLTVDAHGEPEFNLGSADITDALNKQFTVEGEITVVHNDLTFKNYVFNETARALRVDIVNTAVTIGATANPAIRFDLAKVRFSEHKYSISRDGIVTETVKLRGHYSQADSSIGTCRLTNLATSY